MSWRERDYSQAGWGERVVLGVRVPPPGVVALLITHGVAFLALYAAQRDIGPQAAGFGVLTGARLSWPAILLHPFAGADFLTLLILSVSILWMLGGRLEPRIGIGRLLFLYVAGNLFAGAAYFLVARWRPEFALLPLAFPVGASAAWILAGWRELGEEELNLFGWELPAGKSFGYVGLALVLLTLAFWRQTALAWAAAVCAGCLAPVVRGMPRMVIRTIWRPGRVAVQPAARVVRPSVAARVEVEAEPEAQGGVDEILAKISRAGIESLTEGEREQLEAARRELLKRR